MVVPNMKYVLVGIFIFFFVALPMYMLSTLVMPELNSLQRTYTHLDQATQAALSH